MNIIKKLKNKTKMTEKYQIKSETRYLFNLKWMLICIFIGKYLKITPKQLKNFKLRDNQFNNLLKKKKRSYNNMIPFVINKKIKIYIDRSRI